MTRQKINFSPKTLISAPRRSPATPSADGTLALYSQSTYSFETHSKSSGIYVLDINTGKATLLTSDARASEPKWLGLGHEVVWLKEGEAGNTSFVVADATNVGKTYTAGTVSGPVSNLKLFVVEGLKVQLAFSAKSNLDGSLYNPKDVAKSLSTGRIYDSLFVRHWDAYVEPQRSTVWTAVLQKIPSKVTARDGRWNLLGVTNMLRRQTFFECPIPPFGGTDHFDITHGLVAMVSKEPYANPATHTSCLIYTLRIPDLSSTGDEVEEPTEIKIGDGKSRHGAATSPVFSPDGKFLAFLLMAKDGYESDQNQIHIVRIHHRAPASSHPLDMRTATGERWDRSPSSLMFSADGAKLFAITEDTGCVGLFEVDLRGWLSAGSARVTPRKLTSTGSISDIARASYVSRKLFISATSLVDSSYYYILDPSTHPDPTSTLISSLTCSGAAFGLSASQVSSIWWPGAKHSHPVHAWMVTPSFAQPGIKYPLAYLIHGGPQGAWADQWSTRWNPAVFAEQGYVVICPNPTGSTGYGQAFTNAIRNEWGGLPYQDLVKGFEYIETHLGDHIDTTRAVALGASYGGYMINWIQGHPLGRKFKALVCHDGVFSMAGQLASDEQYFPIHDLGGAVWENQAGWDRWDPSRFTGNWATPQLVVHNERDYRLTIAEGLAAFNVLQMRGVESRFLSFPNENHWVLGYENAAVWWEVVISWVNRFVGLPGLGKEDRVRDGVKECRMGRDSRGEEEEEEAEEDKEEEEGCEGGKGKMEETGREMMRTLNLDA